MKKNKILFPKKVALLLGAAAVLFAWQYSRQHKSRADLLQ